MLTVQQVQHTALCFTLKTIIPSDWYSDTTCNCHALLQSQSTICCLLLGKLQIIWHILKDRPLLHTVYVTNVCRLISSKMSPWKIKFCTSVLTYAWKSAMTNKQRRKKMLVTYPLSMLQNSWHAHKLFISTHQDSSSKKHGYINNKQLW